MKSKGTTRGGGGTLLVNDLDKVFDWGVCAFSGRIL